MEILRRNDIPNEGIFVRLSRAPVWVRVWYRVPLLGRLTRRWLWKRGFIEPAGPGGASGPTAGVRHPRPPIVPSSSNSSAVTPPANVDHGAA